MQLLLFGPKPVRILAKLIEEAKAGIKVACHFNGAPLP